MALHIISVLIKNCLYLALHFFWFIKNKEILWKDTDFAYNTFDMHFYTTKMIQLIPESNFFMDTLGIRPTL